MTNSVALLLDKDGKVIAVFAKDEDAKAQADKYNADPFLEPGLPDPAAPYSWEGWVVQEAG